MVAPIRVMKLAKLLLSAVLAAGAALPLAQAQPASPMWSALMCSPALKASPSSCLKMIHHSRRRRSIGQPKMVEVAASADRRGTGSEVPNGEARQFVYLSDSPLVPGVTGAVIAKGQRNEAYATFTVDEECPPLGSVRGTAFEDLNRNGAHDAGEPNLGAASWKLTAGGDWFICGYVGGDSTFGPTVKPGTYTVVPIAQPGWVATTPPRTALVKKLGVAALNNDIGFVRAANASGSYCGQYAPPGDVITPLPNVFVPT